MDLVVARNRFVTGYGYCSQLARDLPQGIAACPSGTVDKQMK